MLILITGRYQKKREELHFSRKLEVFSGNSIYRREMPVSTAILHILTAMSSNLPVTPTGSNWREHLLRARHLETSREETLAL